MSSLLSLYRCSLRCSGRTDGRKDERRGSFWTRNGSVHLSVMLVKNHISKLHIPPANKLWRKDSMWPCFNFQIALSRHSIKCIHFFRDFEQISQNNLIAFFNLSESLLVEKLLMKEPSRRGVLMNLLLSLDFLISFL